MPLLSYGIGRPRVRSGSVAAGRSSVFVEVIPDRLLDRLAEVVERQERAILFTVVDGEQLGEQLLVMGPSRSAPGRTGSPTGSTS